MSAKQLNWFVRHKILSLILAIVIIGGIVAAAGSSKNGSSTTKTSTSTSSSTAKINQPARDGKFEFTVTSLKCGVPSVSQDEFLTKTAQGQYCLVSVSVKNIGDQAQTFDASNQYVYNSQNQKFSADSEASDYANPSGSTFLDDINPGNSVMGTVVFDVPKDVTPVTAELHDSALSGGVKISLQ